MIIKNINHSANKFILTFLLIWVIGCSDESSNDVPPKEDEPNSTLLTNQKISINGTNRIYDVFLPSSHNNSTELPVILDLHGFSSNANEQREISDFTDLAEENDFIMVWPQALATGPNCLLAGVSGKYWNANWGIEVEDINFIDNLIDQLAEDYNVDLKRVYVTGLSNGGFMVYSIACALSERVAAVASVAGSMTEDLLNTTCQPARQIPVMHVHGTDDAVIFWDGEESCQDGIAAINDVVSFWRTNAGCSDTFMEASYEDIDTSDGSTARMLTYNNCGNKMKFLIIDNGGHNWPGSEYQINQGFSILRPINNDIVTNKLIWEFFKQHSLP